ncbi:MAG: flippase-like domain-containing protein [Deltaproteobacteria bacterium]|nr:flippase-like domain-containing protein [Deltaproteobacteria bacterium]
MQRKIVTALVKIAISAAILFFLFRSIDMEAFFDVVKGVTPVAVILAALLFILSQLISTYRWSVLLRKDAEVPYLKLLSFYFIGIFFNNFLPSLIGGDVVKGVYLYRETGKGSSSIASIFMDRYMGLVSIITVVSISLVFGYRGLMEMGGGKFVTLFFIFVVSFLMTSAFIWIKFLHSWLVKLLLRVHLFSLNKKIESFYEIFMEYSKARDRVLKAYGISFLVQFCIIGAYIVLGASIGITISPFYYFLFIPLSIAVAMLPITLAGAGVREAAFVFFFSRAGATSEEAMALSLLLFVIIVLVSLAGGVEFLRAGKKVKKLEDDMASLGKEV